MFLADTAEGAIIDFHCSAKWPNETRIGPKVALRNVGNLPSLATEKSYDEMSFREALRAVGVRPLIKHRVFAPSDHAHNIRIDDKLYHQRSTSESVNSSLKRSHSGVISTTSECLGGRFRSTVRQSSPVWQGDERFL